MALLLAYGHGMSKTGDPVNMMLMNRWAWKDRRRDSISPAAEQLAQDVISTSGKISA
jgi:hypothetical protein